MTPRGGEQDLPNNKTFLNYPQFRSRFSKRKNASRSYYKHFFSGMLLWPLREAIFSCSKTRPLLEKTPFGPPQGPQGPPSTHLLDPPGDLPGLFLWPPRNSPCRNSRGDHDGACSQQPAAPSRQPSDWPGGMRGAIRHPLACQGRGRAKFSSSSLTQSQVSNSNLHFQSQVPISISDPSQFPFSISILKSLPKRFEKETCKPSPTRGGTPPPAAVRIPQDRPF